MSRHLLKRQFSAISESIGVREQTSAPVVPAADPRLEGVAPHREAVRINVDLIVNDPSQPRQYFDEEQLQLLARSIESRGQFAPILVHWSAELQRYQIIAGERRWRATKLAGLTEIDCIIRDADELNESEILAQQLIENCLREDLKVTEQAQVFRELMDRHSWTAKELARELHVSETRVSRALAILKLPPSLVEKVDSGEIPARAAYELSRITDSGVRETLARKVMQGRIRTQDIARDAKVRRTRKSQRPKLTFKTETPWTFVATAGKVSNYDELEEAARQLLAEVQCRARNRIQL